MGTFHSSVSSPMKRNNSSSAVLAKRRSGMVETQSSAVCRELDNFEASMTSLPSVSNFFGTPRSQKRKPLSTQVASGSLTGDMALSRSQSAPATKQAMSENGILIRQQSS